MRKLIVGAIVGGIAAWLYRSQKAREAVSEGFASAPAPVRQGAETLTTKAASAAERAAGIIDASSLPRQVKDSVLRVTSAIETLDADAQPNKAEPAVASADAPAAGGEPVAGLAPAEVPATSDTTKRTAAKVRAKQPG